jgi:2-desacetyl-2-hydroxyethyl bacteriochlorophyllide A dehydrogenase
MLAARIYKAKDLRVEEALRPEIQSGDQIRVRVSAAGICGSDLHVYQTGAYLTRTPITMGHEFAGQVVEIGTDVRKLQVGDHVVGDSRVWCGSCDYCLQTKYNLCEHLGFLGEVCEGAFTKEIVVAARNLIKIDSRVPGHIAALAEPLAVALHAINQSKAADAKNILILGAGPIGALIHTALQVQGAQDLTVVDISNYRRQAIQALGSGSQITSVPEGSYDLVFETTGASPVLQNLVTKSLRKGGQAILVGLFAQESLFNFTDIVENEWDFKGCACFDTELAAAVNMLERYGDRFDHVVSHQLPVSEAQKGFELLLAPEKAAMKIILNPHET